MNEGTKGEKKKKKKKKKIGFTKKLHKFKVGILSYLKRSNIPSLWSVRRDTSWNGNLISEIFK